MRAWPAHYILKFETQLSPTAPVSNSLQLGIPKATLRGTLGAQIGAINAICLRQHPRRREGAVRHAHRHGRIHRQELHDRRSAHLRQAARHRPGEGTDLALQVNDLFDQKPPFFPATDGIGGAYNPIGGATWR
ncbi:hypothetical protein ACRAWD_22850 [Caulobacter segnis]